MGKNQDYEEKKLYVAVYLPKNDVQRIERVLKSGNSIFEDRSQLIRFCIRHKLPEIEKETFEQQ